MRPTAHLTSKYTEMTITPAHTACAQPGRWSHYLLFRTLIGPLVTLAGVACEEKAQAPLEIIIDQGPPPICGDGVVKTLSPCWLA